MNNLYKYIFLSVKNIFYSGFFLSVKNIFYSGLIRRLFFTICIGVGIVACNEMDDVYNDFWKDGEKIYPAFADSVKVHPGKNRIKLTWLNMGDPNVSSATVYWNNKKDSVEVPIEYTGGVDTVKVMLTDMSEGIYVFDIYTYDDKRNSSLGVSSVGTIYGDTYNNLLLNRSISKALFDEGTLEVTWGSPMDETSVGSELTYTDASGVTHSIYVAPDAGTSIIEDYDFGGNDGFIHCKTMYKPEPMAIDTFYTAYDTVKVIGPPEHYSRTGWTITASSFHTGREPEYMIDNDPGTHWWTSGADDFNYPFIIITDIGAEKEPVDGVFLQQRTTRNNPHLKDFEVQISIDGVEWKSMGAFEAADHKDVQYFDFINSEKLRYFKIIYNSTYRNKPRGSLAELGIYHRLK
jgi:hypothetical protein